MIFSRGYFEVDVDVNVDVDNYVDVVVSVVVDIDVLALEWPQRNLSAKEWILIPEKDEIEKEGGNKQFIIQKA